jgi:MoaF N-terminal domain
MAGRVNSEVEEAQQMKSLIGKPIRWTFVDGPMPNTTFEHLLHENGSVTWRILDGQYAGATKTEKAYALVHINAHTSAISYLAASGHTLTVILDLDNGQATAFASSDTSWDALRGTFTILD